MSRVALLIGVSQPTGLDPLLNAQKDVEAMQRVLQRSHLRFTVQALCDQPLQAMQEAIELCFQQRASDDQIVFLFCGYTLQDAAGRLYFTTPSTKLDEADAIIKAQTIPASFMQEVMNSSPAKQQVLMLDTYDRSVSSQPARAEPSDLVAQLGGPGRVILTAANGNRKPTPAAIDAWTYTRYLAEGIESGSADMDDDGRLTAADLHSYATQKLQVAAPALAPQLYGSTETAQMPLLEIPHDDPQVRYCKVLEATAMTDTVDAAGMPMLDSRSLLNEIRQSLGVSPQDAAILEANVLRPVLEYQRRVTFYQEQVADYARSHPVDSPSLHQALQPLQQALGLTDRDVALRSIVPSLAEQQRQQGHYQGNLAQYQQVLLAAMQRQHPLREGDRAMLHRLQQTLRLEDDDVKAIETQITTQAKHLSSEAGNLPATENVAPKTPTASPIKLVSPNAASLPPSPSSEAPKTGAADARAKEVVLHQLLNMTEPSRPSSTNGLSDSDMPAPTSRTVVEREAAPPPHAQSNMDRIRRSASNYQALIIPAILLAAIIGLVAAVLPSAKRPSWFNFGQTPADPIAAQRFKNDGLQKAREGYNKEAIDDYNQAIQKNPKDGSAYIARGVAHHKLGDTGAAIKDYEQALKLDPNSAVPHSNLSYAYYDRQNYDKALEEGNQAVALNGRMAQAHINLANARAKKGDTGGALRDYQQAIALRPPAPAEIQAGAYNNRGNVQLALNKTREALRDYAQAIRLKSDYADAYYNLGLTQQALGNRAAAIRSLQMAASFYQKQNKEALQKEATDRANALQQSNS